MRNTLILSVSSLALAVPLHAKITTEDALKLWEKMSTDAGYTLVVGEKTASGDALRLKDLSLVMKTPEASGEAQIGEVVLTQVGDKVEYSLPETLQFKTTLTTQAEGESETVSVLTTLSQTGFKGEISGTPEAPNFAFDAPKMVISSKIEDAQAEMFPDYSLTFEGVTGNSTFAKLEPLTFDYTFAAKSLLIAAETSVNAQSRDKLRATTVFEDIEGSYTGVLPTGAVEAMSLSQMLTGGLEGSGSFKTGKIRAAMEADASLGLPNSTLLMDKSHITYALDDAGLRYDFGLEGIKPEDDKFADLEANSALLGNGNFTLIPGPSGTDEDLTGEGRAQFIFQDIQPLMKRLLAAGTIDGE